MLQHLLWSSPPAGLPSIDIPGQGLPGCPTCSTLLMRMASVTRTRSLPTREEITAIGEDPALREPPPNLEASEIYR